MAKETWLIEPHDALIVRDGRPFDNTPGTRARSLEFPFPSTTTGGARTRAGLGYLVGDLTRFDLNLAKQLLTIQVRGPLLAELEANGHDSGCQVKTFLAPAPADCLLLNLETLDVKRARHIPLVPLENEATALTNLPEGLHLVGSSTLGKGKPHNNAPRFWYWDKFEDWLIAPKVGEEVVLSSLGHHGLTNEQRTHVRIDYATKANIDGGLFQTCGLEFTHAEPAEVDKFHQRRERLALAVEIELPTEFDQKISMGIAPLGGERRLVAWHKSKKAFPECPPQVRTEIKRTNHCRLILLTPAHFEAGFLPAWLKSAHGIRSEVKAIAVNRAQFISGWDFVLRKPKKTRRLAPAGTVLFLELKGDEPTISDWVDEIWMRCVSDDNQDRKDGFGLAALGVWDGNYQRVSEVLR